MSIALITGASGGIGREFAKELLKSYGVKEFWFVARNEKKLSSLVEEMKEISSGFTARILPQAWSMRSAMQKFTACMRPFL